MEEAFRGNDGITRCKRCGKSCVKFVCDHKFAYRLKHLKVNFSGKTKTGKKEIPEEIHPESARNI
jgi:hypothetical protein